MRSGASQGRQPRIRAGGGALAAPPPPAVRLPRPPRDRRGAQPAIRAVGGVASPGGSARSMSDAPPPGRAPPRIAKARAPRRGAHPPVGADDRARDRPPRLTRAPPGG